MDNVHRVLYGLDMSKVWRAAYKSNSIRGVEVVNTFHFLSNPTAPLGDDPSADTVVDALDSLLTAKYRALVWSGQTIESLTVTEELHPGSGGVPEQAVKSIGLAGTHSPAQDESPMGLTVLLSVKTNAPVRGGAGRIWLPPNMDPSLLNNGLWDTSTTWFTTLIKAFTDALLAGTNYGPLGADGHLSYIVYSRTRRGRDQDPSHFDVTAIVPRATPHFLRSRQTAP